MTEFLVHVELVSVVHFNLFNVEFFELNFCRARIVHFDLKVLKKFVRGRIRVSKELVTIMSRSVSAELG